MQNNTRESVIEALAMLPAALDRLWLQLDSMACDDWIADVIQRDLALLQRLPHQNREPNSAKKDAAELRTDLAEQLRALPEADWTHHFLMDDVWLSIEELLARHIAADCLAVQQLLELATPVEAEAAAPKVLHARQIAGTNTFSRQRIQRTMPHHIRATQVMVPARNRSRLQHIFYFFFETLIEDWNRVDPHERRQMCIVSILVLLYVAPFVPMLPLLDSLPKGDANAVERILNWWTIFWIVLLILVAVRYRKRE